MTILRINAHCFDDDFEKTILEKFGVRVTDKTKAPWEYTFEGTREGLEAMLVEHWGVPKEDIQDELFE